MRLACSWGPAGAEIASCVSSSTAAAPARRAPPEKTCALFSLTFMAPVNSQNYPKRAADYTWLNPRAECLNRVTSPIDDTRTGCWFAWIIAGGTASPVTARLRSAAYLVARSAPRTAGPREPRSAPERSDGIGVYGDTYGD